MRRFRFAVLFAALLCLPSHATWAQGEKDYTRLNTFTAFADGSDTSSHILLGYARNRQLLEFGGAYGRRLIHRRTGDFSYLAELRPVVLLSDPVTVTAYAEYTTSSAGQFFTSGIVRAREVARCQPTSGVTHGYVGNVLFTESYNVGCGRQRSFGQAFAPIGLKYAFLPAHRLQPFVVGTLGYIYTNRPVPISTGGSANFDFDLGVGLELYRARHRSTAVEYRYHHISNKNTATSNPGIDNMTVKLSYSFGH